MKVNKPLIGLLAASVLALGVFYLASQDEGEDEEDEEEEDDEGGEIDIDAMSEALQEDDGKGPLVMPKHASALCQAAATHRAKGEGNEAASCYLRALKIIESVLGPAHPHNATVLSALGGVLLSMGDAKEAEPVFRRTLIICENALGPNHPSTATVLNNLASSLLSQNKLAEAEALFLRSLAICEAAFGSGHVETATALGNLAVVLQDGGRFAEAEAVYVRALAAKQAGLGLSHESTQSTAKALVACRALAVRAAVELCVHGEAVAKADVAWAPAASATPLLAALLEVAVADPALADADLANAPGSLAGKCALVVRGSCSFTDKVDRCVAAGAVCVLVANDDADAPDVVFTMGSGSADYASAVPVAMVSFNEGQRLMALAGQAGVVSFRAEATAAECAAASTDAPLLDIDEN